MFGFLTILLASFIQGVTGFGFALIAVPLLSFFIPELRSITPIIVVYSLWTNIIILYKSRHLVDFKTVPYLIIFGLAATPFGTYILLYTNGRTLKAIVGIVTTITAIVMFKNVKVKIKNERISYGIVGVLSGLLNGSIGLSGPPIVLFLTNQNLDKDVFRSNLAFYGFVTNIFAIVMFILKGIMNASVINFTISYFPALLIGVIGGIKAVSKIKETLFRDVTIYLIMFLGLYTFISTIMK